MDFGSWLTLPLGVYFIVTAYQGFHRFRVLIPLILLLQIYVDRRGERWPTLKSAVLLIFAALMFFPLKGIARELQEGEDLTYVSNTFRRVLGKRFTARMMTS